jgi:uncharacterized membrane protein
MITVSRIDRVVARVLLWGGLVSVALILGGLLVYAAAGHPNVREIVRVVHNREAGRSVDVFTSLGDVGRALTQRPPDALAVTALGLVCLLITPALGVAVAIAGFWRAGDHLYAGISAIVLTMLIVSFTLAATG